MWSSSKAQSKHSKRREVCNLVRVRVKVVVIVRTSIITRDATVMENRPLLDIRCPTGTRCLSYTVIDGTDDAGARVVKKGGGCEWGLYSVSQFIRIPHTIIRSHNLNSRDATSANGGDNANLCHYTVTLNLVIQARIRTIQLRGNSTTGSTGVGGDGFIRVLIPRRTRNNRGVIRTTRYWDRKHSLDGDADADSASTRRSRRRTRAAATVARVRTIAAITRRTTTIAASILVHVGRHLRRSLTHKDARR